MKRCPDCGETKQPEEFYSIKLKRKDGRIEPGLSAYCRLCSNKRVVICLRERYKDDPDYRAMRNRQSAESERRKRESDPDYAEAANRKAREKRQERQSVKAKLGLIPPRLCSDCGRADISEQSPKAKYCPDCKRERRQATVRKYSLSQSQSRKAKAKGED